MNTDCNREYCLVDVLRTIFAFRRIIVLITFVGVLVTACFVYKFLPERYSSCAIVKFRLADSKLIDRDFTQHRIDQLADFCRSDLNTNVVVDSDLKRIKLTWYGTSLVEVERARNEDLSQLQSAFLDKSNNPYSLYSSLLGGEIESTKKVIEELEKLLVGSTKQTSRISRELQALYITYAGLNEKLVLAQVDQAYWVRSVTVSQLPISDKPIPQHQILILIFGFFASMFFAVAMILLWQLAFEKKDKLLA